MVKIVGYKIAKKESGDEFCLLIVQGGIEVVRSQATNKTYFTARTVNVPATFGEDMCRNLVGTEFEGHIIKVSCEPYEYIIKETGETMVIDYKYEFVDQETMIIDEQVIDQELVN